MVLFDLGGVLIKLGKHPLPADWIGNAGGLTLREWFSSQSGRDFETGLISPHEFAAAMKREFNIEQSSERIIAEFARWPEGLYPGSEQVLGDLRESYRLAVLSNSNELHWPRITTELGLSDYFEQMYSSHIIGAAKPDSKSFDYVVKATGCDPEEILFFDDSEANIKAATNFGMNGVLVGGLADVAKYFNLPLRIQG